MQRPAPIGSDQRHQRPAVSLNPARQSQDNPATKTPMRPSRERAHQYISTTRATTRVFKHHSFLRSYWGKNELLAPPLQQVTLRNERPRSKDMFPMPITVDPSLQHSAWTSPHTSSTMHLRFVRKYISKHKEKEISSIAEISKDQPPLLVSSQQNPVNAWRQDQNHVLNTSLVTERPRVNQPSHPRSLPVQPLLFISSPRNAADIPCLPISTVPFTNPRVPRGTSGVIMLQKRRKHQGSYALQVLEEQVSRHLHVLIARQVCFDYLIPVYAGHHGHKLLRAGGQEGMGEWGESDG